MNQSSSDVKLRDELAENLKNILISRRAQIGSETCKDAFCKGFDSAIEHTRKKAEWKFCPECGSDRYRNIYANELQCMDCGQSWFRNVNYADIMDKKLKRISQQTKAAEILVAALKRLGAWHIDHIFPNIANAALDEYEEVMR